MRQNSLYFFILLCLILLQDSKVSSAADETDQSCEESHQLEEQCGPYAHKIVKPMMAYFDQVTQKIDNNNAEMERKNNEIGKLEKEVASSFKDHSTKFLQDMSKDFIKSLQQQIDYLSRRNEKLEGNLVDKKTTEILEIAEKCETNLKNNNEKVLYLEKEMESLKQKVNLLTSSIEKKNKEVLEIKEQCQTDFKNTHEKVLQLEEEFNKVAHNSEEIEQQVNLLSNSTDKQNLEINELKVKINVESVKVLEYEKQLKSQKEIIFAKEPNIPQLEKEIKKLIQQSNEIEKIDKKSCIGIFSGVHKIKLSNDTTFDVLCNSDIAGPGWTVIQQRIRGGVEFQRDWNTYLNGFGDFWDGDFFLGLEKIHRLTTDQPHELYIHMQRFDGSTYYARYDEFAISGEDKQYQITKIDGFSGSIYDYSYMGNYKGIRFTTYDRDNDEYSDGNCAEDWNYGGWWYYNCAACNMNGKYFHSEVEDMKGIFWNGYTSLKQVRMMIRPKAV